MDIEEMIEVLEAYRDGRRIQSKSRVKPEWLDNDKPQFSFDCCEYRIAPEPLTLWANIGKDRDWYYVYTSENEARKDAMPLSDFSRVAVKMAEVTDE